MIEFRWLEKKPEEGFREIRKILQQRILRNQDRWIPEGKVVVEQTWSDWEDVPTVKES